MTAGAIPVWAAPGATFSATAAGAHLIDVPAHAAGDLLLLTAHARASDNNGSVGSLGSGWTQHGGAGNVYGTGITRVALGWRKGDGALTSVSATFGGTGTVRFQARVHRITAADGFGPAPIEAVAVTSGSGTQVTIPTVSPAGVRRLGCALTSASVATAMASATGESGGDWTEPTDEHQSSDGTLGLQTSAQAGGAQISGGGFAITSAAWVSVGFALAPIELYALDATTLALAAVALPTPLAFSVLDLASVAVLISDHDVASAAASDT